MGLRYEFDPFNRLVILDALDAVQPRRVVEGRVSIDAKNRLVYRAATLAPNPDAQARDPEAKSRWARFRKAEYVFDGTWSLTPGRQLALALHDRQDPAREEVFLKAALQGATGHSLTAVLEHGEGQKTASQRVSLAGRWQADAQNRLTFLVEKANGRVDELVFDAAWELGPRRELRYQSRKSAAASSPEQAIRLAGAWDLTPDSQLVYRLDGDTRSVLAFQAAIQSRSLQARDGKLTYQLGIRLSDGRTVARQVALFGAWKLHKDLSVSFELPGTRRQAAKFQGTCTFRDRNTLTIELSGRRGESTGLAVTFSRRWMDDAEWFLRAQRTEDDTQLLGGVRVRF